MTHNPDAGKEAAMPVLSLNDRTACPDGATPLPANDRPAALLALDLGTTTGWALRLDDGAIVSGTVTFRPGRGASPRIGLRPNPGKDGSAHSSEWRDIPGWPEYQVSQAGEVRRVAHATGATVGRVLKQCRNKNTGYHSVCLSRNCIQSRIDVHRLVAFAFHGPQPSADHVVAHNDGCRTNNHYSNLRWATQSENLRDCRKHGTALLGSRNPSARIDEIDAQAIRRMKAAGIPRPVIAEGYGLHKRTVFRILSGMSWGHVQ